MAATAHPKMLRPRRLIDPADVVCPAGCPARAGSGVLCRIEGGVIDARTNPYSLRDFCLGDYQACPTWRVAREAELAGRGQEFEREVRRER